MTDAPLDLDALERSIQNQLDRTRRMQEEPLISCYPHQLRALISAARELAVVKAERDKFALCVKQDADQRSHYEGMLDEQDKELAALRASRYALRTALEGADSTLKAYEEWEADLILTGDWSGEGVRMDQRQHDAMMKLQENRNAVLATIRKALT